VKRPEKIAAGNSDCTLPPPPRPGDLLKLVVSAEKAVRELGWKPKFPKLEDIVATVWAWHKKHPTEYPDQDFVVSQQKMAGFRQSACGCFHLKVGN
jgi:hypothetical protein